MRDAALHNQMPGELWRSSGFYFSKKIDLDEEEELFFER